jgi:uncharacterized protein (DUF2252 family)
VQKLVSGLHNRHKNDEFRVLDAAYWVKECSSLGRFRFAVLLEVGKRHREGRFCLIDIKEAIEPAAPPAPSAKMRKIKLHGSWKAHAGCRHFWGRE